MQIQLAARHARNFEQIIDQPRQVADLALHHLTEACSLRLSGEPRPQDVQGVADRRERIAQLVREDRQEFVLALIVEAQTLFGFGQVEEIAADRSGEGRVGKGWFRRCRSRWSEEY